MYFKISVNNIAIHCCPSPSIHPLLSSCCHTIHCCPLPPLIPMPLSCHRAINRRPLPIAIETPLRSPLLSLPSSHLLPSNYQCAIHRPSWSSIHHHCTVNCCCAVNRCQAVHHCRALNCCLLTMWYNCVSMYSTLLYFFLGKGVAG